MSLLEKTFLALDGMTKTETFTFLDQLSLEKPRLKIGLELFCQYGPSIVSELALRYQAEIFLDLKLHDIPNTVAKSIKALSSLPITFLTIHLAGGEEMAEAALDSRDKYLPLTKILGVTFLTSLAKDDLEKQFAQREIKDFDNYLSNFLMATIPNKLDGVICSAWEVPLYKAFRRDLLCVCPGIRFSEDQDQDQKRICTPEMAKKLAADFLVIGRAITNSKKPQKEIEYLRSL